MARFIIFAPAILKTPKRGSRQVQNQNLLNNFGDVIFWPVAYRHKNSFLELLYIQRDFPWEHQFLVPEGQKGVGRGSKLIIWNLMLTRDWNLHRHIILLQKFDCSIYLFLAIFCLFLRQPSDKIGVKSRPSL